MDEDLIHRNNLTNLPNSTIVFTQREGSLLPLLLLYKDLGIPKGLTLPGVAMVGSNEIHWICHKERFFRDDSEIGPKIRKV